MVQGQKVVCVDDNFHPEIKKHYTSLPVKDHVYVIRDVVLGISARGEPGEVCLYLLGLHNPRSNKAPFPERGFNAERFRPLQEITRTLTEEVEDEAETTA